MANKQYIGARYVPLICGEWDENKVYEPLSIVLYLNSSYTSKKEVPAGTLPTDTTYWAMTGNYNALIGQLSERIDGVAGDVSALDDRVEALENITSDKYIVCVGDSYGVLTDHPWPSVLQTLTGLDSDHFKNVCVSGGGIVGNAGSAGYYITQLQDASITNKDTVSDIIIAGGFNDAYTTNYTGGISEEQVAAGFSAIKSYVAEHYPNAKVHVGFLGYASNQGTNMDNASTARKNCAKMAEYYKYYAITNGFTYMNGVENVLHRNALFDETFAVYDAIFHPNIAGNRHLANAIYNCLHTGSCDVNYAADLSITPATGLTISAYAAGTAVTLKARNIYHNGFSKEVIGVGAQYVRVYGLSVTSTGNDAILIGGITGDACVFPSGNEATCRYTAMGTIITSTSTHIAQAMQVIREGTGIYLLVAAPAGETITTVAFYPAAITGTIGDM